jgi:hypothetical protein
LLTSSTVVSHTGQPEKHAVDRHLRPPPPPCQTLGRSRGLVKSLANIRGEYGTTDYLAGTAAGGEDHHHTSTPIAAAVRHCHGLRLLCVDTGGWIRIAYADDDPVDCAAAVRRRVGSLLRNPHIIPTYSLVECNCECVAV